MYTVFALRSCAQGHSSVKAQTRKHAKHLCLLVLPFVMGSFNVAYLGGIEPCPRLAFFRIFQLRRYIVAQVTRFAPPLQTLPLRDMPQLVTT